MNDSTLTQTKTAESTFVPVHSGVLQRKCDCGNHTVAGGECAECGKKGGTSLQRSATSNQPMNGVPPIVHDVLGSPGQPLDPATRAFMEPKFRHDFSQVRVHADERAAESARNVYASAYTVGSQIVFAPGRYAPRTTAGNKLLAHELTHVVQQTGEGGHAITAESAEAEAQNSANLAMSGGSIHLQTAVASGVMRELDPDEIRRQLAELELRAAKPVSMSPDEVAALQAEQTNLRNLLDSAMRARAGFSGTGTSAAAPQSSVAPNVAPSNRVASQAVPPDEMVKLVVEQRGFSAGQTGPTKALGQGYQTNAALQVVDGKGNQVAFELALYGGGGGPHAEAQAVARLKLRLGGSGIPGGRLIVAVDQTACGDCLARLSALAHELGLDGYEIWGPLRAKATGSGNVTLKTGARTAASVPKAQADADLHSSNPVTSVDGDATLKGITESNALEASSPGAGRANYRMNAEMIQGESFAPRPLRALNPKGSDTPTPTEQPRFRVPELLPERKLRLHEGEVRELDEIPEPPPERKLRLHEGEVRELDEIPEDVEPASKPKQLARRSVMLGEPGPTTPKTAPAPLPKASASGTGMTSAAGDLPQTTARSDATATTVEEGNTTTAGKAAAPASKVTLGTATTQTPSAKSATVKTPATPSSTKLSPASSVLKPEAPASGGGMLKTVGVHVGMAAGTILLGLVESYIKNKLDQKEIDKGIKAKWAAVQQQIPALSTQIADLISKPDTEEVYGVINVKVIRGRFFFGEGAHESAAQVESVSLSGISPTETTVEPHDLMNDDVWMGVFNRTTVFTFSILLWSRAQERAEARSVR